MKKSLGKLALVLAFACILVARDFVGTVVFASFTVTTFYPVFRRLTTRVNAKLAALVLTFSIVVVIVGPLVVAVVLLSSRVAGLVNEIVARWQSGDLSAAVSSLSHDQVSLPKLGELYREIARATPGVLTSVGKVFFALSDVAVKSFLFVLLLYGFFVKGPQAAAWLERASPLGDKPTRELMAVYVDTGRGILVGVFLVVIVHGVVATIGYLVVGIGRAVELGALTALAGLLPAIGTALVWAPLAAVLLATGNVGQAIGVFVVGPVVGSADNLLRPWLSRLGNVPLPTLPLFIAFFGGITTFGPAGVLLGPLFFALAKTAIDLYVAEPS